MEKEPGLPKSIKAVVASVLNRAEIALISADGTPTYSEVPTAMEGFVKGEALRSFPHWSVGDYSIKHLDRTSLLIGKVRDDTTLAINSIAKTGLLILAFERVVATLKNPSVEKEVAPQAPRILAEATQVALADVKEVKTETLAPRGRIVDSPVLLNPWVVLELATTSEARGIELDADMIRLVRAVDGVKSAEGLAKETSLRLEVALAKLNFLKEKGILKVRYDEPIYQRMPRTIGQVDGVAPIAFGISFGKMRNLKDLLKRLDGKKTVLALAVELEIEPEKLRVLVENLERKKLIQLSA